MSTVLEHIELKPPVTRSTWGGEHPDPEYYYSHKDRKEYLLIFPHFGNSSFIHKYDIADNLWTNDISYNDLNIQNHDTTIDYETNTLYLLGEYTFAIFDLKQNCWKDSGDAIDYNITPACVESLIYFPSPINELHTFIVADYKFEGYKYEHYKFDSDSQKFVECQSNINFNSYRFTKVIYLEQRKKLMIFSVQGIYQCDIKINQNEYNWKKLGIEMPISNEYEAEPKMIKCAIPSFGDQILFLFSQNPVIYCLDLVYNEWIVYEDKELRFQIVRYMNTRLGNEFIYFLESFSAIHFKVKLNEILPKELREKHVKRDELLISGYILTIDKSLALEIPSDLMRLLTVFVSDFV